MLSISIDQTIDIATGILSSFHSVHLFAKLVLFFGVYKDLIAKYNNANNADDGQIP
jgi:hypothetical protein